MDEDTARLYGTAFNELRRRGKALSQVDLMLAALARQHKLVILSTDGDFDALPDIKRQNWID
jgi:tRNA(fMet)-specific endonuclease VapC